MTRSNSAAAMRISSGIAVSCTMARPALKTAENAAARAPPATKGARSLMVKKLMRSFGSAAIAFAANCGAQSYERLLFLLVVLLQGCLAWVCSQLNAFASWICNIRSPSVAVLTWICVPVKVLGLTGAAVMLAVLGGTFVTGTSTAGPLETPAR